jgi:hypothetical protein
VAQTLVRKVMLQIASDDGDTEEKLDRISDKASELARQHPELAVRIDTAAAAAKLAVLRRELKDTGNQSDKSSFSIKSFGSALNDSITGLPTGVEEMSMFQKVMAGFNLATGLAEPLLAGVTVGVMGLAGGLVSAGAGAGIFGVVAKEEFSAVSTNITSATTALNAMGSATSLKQQTADAKAFNAALKGLSGPQKELVTASANAESGWDYFVKSAAGGVDKTLAPALRLVPGLLRDANEFLGPVEAGLDKVVAQFSKGFASAGIQGFIHELAADSGTDLDKIAVMLGHVVVGITGILHAFMPMSGTVLSGLDKMTAKFETWGNTLPSHNGFQDLMSMAKQDAPIVIRLLGNLGGIIKTVASQMTGMDTAANSKTLIQLAAAVSGLVNGLLKAHPQLVWIILYMKMAADGGGKLISTVKSLSGTFKDLQTGKKTVEDFAAGFGDAKKAADDATGAAGTWGGKTSSVLSGIKSLATQAAQKLGLIRTATEEATVATEGETDAQEGLDVAMEANPVGLVIVAVAALGAGIYELAKHSEAFRAFWKSAWKDIEKTGDDAWHLLDNDLIHPLEKGVDGLVSFVKSNWRTLATILATVLLGPIGGLVVFVATHWSQIRGLTSRLTDDVTGFFRALPGRIMSEIDALPGQLYNFGSHIISMLADGIMAAGGGVLSGAMHDVMSVVSDFLPHSPAKRGPLSGAGSPDIAGRKLGQMFAGGIGESAVTVSSAAARVARAASIGAAASPALAGGGRGGTLQIEWVGGQSDQQFLTWIKKNIRIRGGDPGNLGR